MTVGHLLVKTSQTATELLHNAMSQIGPVQVHLTKTHGPIKMIQAATKRGMRVLVES